MRIALRRGIWSAFCLILVFAAAVRAAPIGNVRPEEGRWKIGAELGFGVGGDLEYAGQPSGSDAEMDQHYLYVFRAAYGFTDNFEAFLRLGGGSAQVSESLGGITTAADLQSAFVGGFGVQGRFQDALGSWDLAAHASYLVHANRDTINLAAGTGGFAVGIGDIPADVDVSQWQGGILLQNDDLGAWTPYVGLSLSNTVVEWSILGLPLADYETENVAGVVLGTGYDFSDSLEVNVEGRLVDEYAVNVGLLWTL